MIWVKIKLDPNTTTPKGKPLNSHGMTHTQTPQQKGQEGVPAGFAEVGFPLEIPVQVQERNRECDSGGGFRGKGT